MHFQRRAREWVSTKLECNSSRRISLFETNIRVVGGLLGAFELSADQMFLDKAVECVNLMLPVFETSSTGKHDMLLLHDPTKAVAASSSQMHCPEYLSLDQGVMPHSFMLSL